MRSSIAMITLVVAAAPLSFAQTLDAPFAFSLSSPHGHLADAQRPTVKVVAYGLGDIPGSAIASTLERVAASRLLADRRYAPLSLPAEFSDDYDFDLFPYSRFHPRAFLFRVRLGHWISFHRYGE